MHSVIIPSSRCLTKVGYVPAMLAALNVGAVALGLAGGGLVATISSLALGAVLSGLGVPNGADLGLLLGVVTGFAFGGWVGGRMAVHSHRFHGSVTGLLLGGLIVLLASTGSAAMSIVAILTLSVVAVVVGGLGGWVGGRNRPGPLK
jgi:hypothetical protein